MAPIEAQAIFESTKEHCMFYLQKLLFPTHSAFEAGTALPFYDYRDYSEAEEPLGASTEQYHGLRIKYFINRHGHLWARDHEFIPADEPMEDRPRGLDPTIDVFYYTVVDSEQNLVGLGTLPELDMFPFVDGAFFNIGIALERDPKWIKIYRNENLLLSHVVPVSNSKLAASGY